MNRNRMRLYNFGPKTFVSVGMNHMCCQSSHPSYNKNLVVLLDMYSVT